MAESRVFLDGAMGEGGGQILRTALALSAITGKPFRLQNIRAGRPHPGLAAQHLTAIQATTAIARAVVRGAALSSTEIEFRPGTLHGGTYRFAVGTAGSTTLVFQTAYLPLAFSSAAAHLTISGGTHVPWSPPYEHLTECWAHYAAEWGLKASFALRQVGYYPRGGGEIAAILSPCQAFRPLRLEDRGSLRSVSLRVGFSQLAESIARRMLKSAEEHLLHHDIVPGSSLATMPAAGPGIYLWLRAEYQRGVAGFSRLGQRGKRAELLAGEVIEDFLAFHRSSASVDTYLADQLVLPLSLASGSSYLRTQRITPHLLTNIHVIHQFLPGTIRVIGREGEPGEIIIEGVGWRATR